MSQVSTDKTSTERLKVTEHLWIGGLIDVATLVEQAHCELILDVRAEKVPTGKEHPEHYAHFPLADGLPGQEAIIGEAITLAVSAIERGRRVGIHCTDSCSRAGCIVAGVLIRLGECDTVEEAGIRLRGIRPGLVIHPELVRSLRVLFDQEQF